MNGHSDLVKAALVWLQLTYPHGVFYKTNTGAFAGEYKGRKRFVKFGVKGLADITGVLPGGHALYLECKVGRDKQSSNQKAFEKAAINAGALYLEVRDLDDLKILSDLV